jgi:hypothetical protein
MVAEPLSSLSKELLSLTTLGVKVKKTSQRTWNQGTVEGMDDRPSTWQMSGSGEAVNMLFNTVAPNWANHKRCYQLNLES